MMTTHTVPAAELHLDDLLLIGLAIWWLPVLAVVAMLTGTSSVFTCSFRSDS